MHLTAEETYTLISSVVALVGVAAAWLKSHSAGKAAARAEQTAKKALNGTAGPAGSDQPPDSKSAS